MMALSFMGSPVFSQVGSTYKPDTLLLDLPSFDELNSLNFKNGKKSFELLKPRHSPLALKGQAPLPNCFEKQDNPRVIIKNHGSMGNMPCLVPPLDSRMPVHVPDTTTMYSLRIKRIK